MTRLPTAVLAAAALSAAAATSAGCGAAVRHPAIAAGVVTGTFGFGTCKLESANTTACLGVAGGAGALLGLVTATALWLIGDGPTEVVDEQVEPLPVPDDGPPIKRHRKRAEPAAPKVAPTPTEPAPAAATPIEPVPAAPTPTEPAPAAPTSPEAVPQPTPPTSPPPS